MGTMRQPIGALTIVQLERERLKAVTGIYFDAESHKPMLTAIRFQFESRLIELRCDDDDAIKLSECSETKVRETETIISLSAELPWARAISKPILWVWSMTNQYNYFDGIQIHFADNVEDPGVLIQMITGAGRLSVRTL